MWREIPGYEGLYSANEEGQIISHAGKRNGANKAPTKDRILRPGKTIAGYLFVGLRKNNRTKLILIHRLVALSFIPNPENKKTVNHKDGNISNNKLENLEWMTQRENALHSYEKLGRKPVKGKTGKDNTMSLPVIQLTKGGEFVARYDSITDAEKKLGLNNICVTCRGKQLTCGGFRWKYAK